MEVPTLNELTPATKEVVKTVAEYSSVAPKICKSRKPTPDGGGYGTGSRKNAVARVWVKPGSGKITINKKDLYQYITRPSYIVHLLQPFVDTNTSGQFDVVCTAKGGGTTGQVGAIVHGIARALDCISEDYHAILRKNGFLTRDPRVVERKKYGKRKARKSTQFSKR